MDAAAEWTIELADRGFHVVLAEADRLWVTLPVELAVRLQKAGFGDVIDARTLVNPNNPGATTRAALRLHGASTDEAYPTTRPRSGVALGAAPDWKPGETWDSVSAALASTAHRVGHVDVLFLGGSTIQALTGHRHRVAQPGGPRPFDELSGPRRAAGFGVAGERTEHLLWRVQQGLLEQMTPHAIVIQVGAHNVIGPNHSMQETMDGVVALIDAVESRAPGARIAICTPLPAAGPTSAYVHHAVASLRSEILRHEFAPGTLVIDSGAAFTRADGSLDTTLSGDGLTLTPLGETTFLGAIRAELFPLLRR